MRERGIRDRDSVGELDPSAGIGGFPEEEMREAEPGRSTSKRNAKGRPSSRRLLETLVQTARGCLARECGRLLALRPWDVPQEWGMVSFTWL